jgi:hypothetical protein
LEASDRETPAAKYRVPLLVKESRHFGFGVFIDIWSMYELFYFCRDTQKKYSNILRLSRALTSHFYHVVQTQVPTLSSETLQKALLSPERLKLCRRRFVNIPSSEKKNAEIERAHSFLKYFNMVVL